MIARADFALMIDANDNQLRMLRAEPAEPILRMLPTEPIDRIEPVDPIDRMLPADPTLRMLPVELRDLRDLDMGLPQH